MEKYFITKESLPEIISDLANAILKNAEKISMNLEVVRYSNEDNLIVHITRRSDWKRIKTMTYTIIDKVDDCFDVMEFTVNEALAMVDNYESEKVEEVNEIEAV